jgi:hypothetical protein
MLELKRILSVRTACPRLLAAFSRFIVMNRAVNTSKER